MYVVLIQQYHLILFNFLNKGTFSQLFSQLPVKEIITRNVPYLSHRYGPTLCVKARTTDDAQTGLEAVV